MEEGQMKRWPGYLLIAVLLTLVDGAVAVYSGLAIWKAWSGDIRNLGFWVLLSALGATPLVNVWVQALAGSVDLFGVRTIESGHGATRIPTEARGSGNV
jgi:hypothetical protein